MSLTSITHESWGEAMKSSAARSSIMEAVGGIVVVVLSIIGLAGAAQSDMAAISAIVIGASLMLECGTLAANYRRRLLNEAGSGVKLPGFEGIVTFEFMAGIAGILLGILALLGVATWTLISVATIVLGCAYMLNSGTAMRMHAQWTSGIREGQQPNEAVGIATSSEIGVHMLIGLAAIVLGILALLRVSPAVLNLVAFLALGVSILLSSSFLGVTRMLQTKAA